MITSPFEAMARLFEAALSDLGVDAPRPNVSPTQSVPVAVSRGDGRLLVPMRWGFVPSWAKAMNDGPLLINARAETIAEKPAFRTAARERRCLIPADGFYEWQGEKGAKTPFVIRPADGGMLAFAGVWQDWRGPDGVVPTCAIVTCAANESAGADPPPDAGGDRAGGFRALARRGGTRRRASDGARAGGGAGRGAGGRGDAGDTEAAAGLRPQRSRQAASAPRIATVEPESERVPWADPSRLMSTRLSRPARRGATSWAARSMT